MLNVIHFVKSAREKSDMDVSFIAVIVKICIMNYAYQNTTRNTILFEKIMTFFCVTAAAKENIA